MLTNVHFWLWGVRLQISEKCVYLDPGTIIYKNAMYVYVDPDQCPKIGWFGWEMTPIGEQFSTLAFDIQCEFLTLSWWFGICDCDNTATNAKVNWNHQFSI